MLSVQNSNSVILSPLRLLTFKHPYRSDDHGKRLMGRPGTLWFGIITRIIQILIKWHHIGTRSLKLELWAP